MSAYQPQRSATASGGAASAWALPAVSLAHPAIPPIALIAVMQAAFTIWNHFARLTWATGDTISLLAALLPCVPISAYAGFRAAPRLAELTLVLPFYLYFPVLGVQLSYLAFTWQRPLVDALISRLDLAVGFSWGAWAAFVAHVPGLKLAQLCAYDSHFYQMVASVLVFALARPRSRNYEMLFILVLGLILTVIVCGWLPTLGPEAALGTLTSSEQIIRDLRAGQTGPFPYTGIVTFPSYHTVLAITFIYCHRDIRRTRFAVLLLNLAMLFSIPYTGDHYVTDMAGGASVALVSILASRLCYRRRFTGAVFARGEARRGEARA